MQLILFTSSYPYDYSAEYAFIEPEISYLAEKFSRIILVPRASRGQRLPLPVNVELDEGYANVLRSDLARIIYAVVSSRLVRDELRKRPDIWLYPSKILKLALFASRVELTREWVTKLIKNQQIDPNECLLYSYWMDHAATGLAMAKLEFPALKVISRAHGFDIFEEYYYPHYWPYREETLELLDGLFVASDSGRKHFCEHYPQFESKFETAHLGIHDPGIISRPSEDGVFRIVSCSYILPVKRLSLLLDGIIAAARRRPAQKIEWTHFGDGSGRKSLEKRIRRDLPRNVDTHLMGHVPNHEIMRFYKEHPADVFINVSKTEGGAPVSIQEATSCGIPIVATTIGGNPEIVSEENGILIGPDPIPDEIANAFFQLMDDPAGAMRKRSGGRKVWHERYNAAVNSLAFAERLKTIRESA